MSCGTALEARRNSDERWTFTPSSRNYTFSGMAPLFTVRRGETVLLQIDQTQTINGSLFSVVGDSVVLQLKKGDAALLDGPTPDTNAEALFYDVTLTDQTGFENWIVGGSFTLLGLNDVSCGGCNEKVEVTIGGQCIQINIEGGNLGIGASVNLAALNQAVQDAETAAGEAEQSAAEAATAGATAGAAAGASAGDAAGAASGAAAGTASGAAAANAVVAGKANINGDNVMAGDFRAAIGADQSVNVLYQGDGIGAAQRTLLAFARSFRLVTNYSTDTIGDGATSATLAIQRAIDALPTEGGCVIFPEAVGYMIDATVNIYKPVKFMMLGGAGSLKLRTNMVTGDVLNITAPGFTMDGFYFESTVVKTSGAFFYLSQTAPFWHITNFQMRGHYIGFEVDGASLFTCSNGHFRNPTTRTQATGGGHMVIGRNNMTVVSNLDNLTSGKDGSTTLADMPSFGIKLQYIDAVVAHNCDLTVSGKAWWLAPASGQVCGNFNMTGICHGDSGEVGIAVEPAAGGVVVGFTGQTVWGATNTAQGISFAGAGDIIGFQIVTPQFVNNSGDQVSFNNAAQKDIRFGVGIIAGKASGVASATSGVFANTNCDGFSFLGTRIGPTDNYGANAFPAFLGAGLTDYAFIDCDMRGNTNPYSDASLSGDVRGCAGVVTRNRGIQEVTSAQTSVVINHGLIKAPTEGSIRLTPRTAWQSSAQWWVDTVTATSFTLHVNPAPGSSIFFGWSADCEQR